MKINKTEINNWTPRGTHEKFICMWCDDWTDDYDFFCSDRCRKMYNKYGKIRNTLTAPNRFFHRSYDKILGRLLNEKCRFCGTRMTLLGNCEDFRLWSCPCEFKPQLLYKKNHKGNLGDWTNKDSIVDLYNALLISGALRTKGDVKKFLDVLQKGDFDDKKLAKNC